VTTRRWVVVSAAAAIALVVAGGVWFGFAGFAGLAPAPGVDEWWGSLMVSVRTPDLTTAALFLDFFGTGWIAWLILPLLAIAALLCFRRPWAALFLALSLIASVVAAQALKHLVGRPRPLNALVVSDFGSYPSGHVANAVTLTVAIALIVRVTWVWAAGAIYSLAMLLSRTYLGIHWLTDTLAAALLGAAVTLLLAAAFGSKLEVRTAHHPPAQAQLQ
jgi:membrane-associated phospholipid phosphatase